MPDRLFNNAGKSQGFSHPSARYLKQVPFAGDGFQSLCPTVHELDVRAGDQVLYGAGKEDLVRICHGGDRFRNIDRDSM